MKRKTYTISNLAGGDLRRFRTDQNGDPSDASIRHAARIVYRTGMDFLCSDGDLYDTIAADIAEAEPGAWR